MSDAVALTFQTRTDATMNADAIAGMQRAPSRQNGGFGYLRNDVATRLKSGGSDDEAKLNNS
jgi:hypothetical protein